MGIREDLLRQEDVKEEDVDDILIRAQKKFEHEEQGQGKKSLVVDVEDIPIRFIDEAMEELVTEREEAAEAKREAQQAIQDELSRRRKIRLWIGLITTLVIAGGSVGAAYLGQGPIEESYLKVEQAGEVLKEHLDDHDILIERYNEYAETTIQEETNTALTPVGELELQYQSTKGLLKRAQVAQSHKSAMQRRLDELISYPEEGLSSALSNERVDLGFRIRDSALSLQSAKAKRAAAEEQWRESTSTFTGWVAVQLGMAPGPQE